MREQIRPLLETTSAEHEQVARLHDGKVDRFNWSLLNVRHVEELIREAQPPSFRQTAIYWVVSAKRAETQERRLTRVIEDSAAGRRLAQLTPPERRQSR
jgi:Bacteriocin-protection, YdeI or OmpD-Associated